MGYSIKNNEILVHATTWMNSELTPSERSQSKDHILYDFIHMKHAEEANPTSQQVG